MELPTAKKITGLKRMGQQIQAVDQWIGLDAERIFRSRFESRRNLHLQKVSEAARVIERLPEPGEVFTVLMSGSFDGWDYVSAVLQLAAPLTIDTLHVATLGFNESNTGELLHYLDNGQIKSVWFLASCYMRDASNNLYAPLVAALEKRNQKIKATRNHAKLLCFTLSDGRKIVIDGSMNLRSCRNVEQAHVWADDDLHDFYASYIEEAISDPREVK